MMMCPCGSNQTYETCCQLYHLGLVAADAQTLMRSRYSAFVVGDIDYIIKTTLPAQAKLLDRQALQAWSDEMTWLGLEIKSHIAKIGKRHAQVHFVAHYQRPDGSQGQHIERSAFVQIKENQDRLWYFLDPTVDLSITNKQPCPCGSGEKFKSCCGKFLS